MFAVVFQAVRPEGGAAEPGRLRALRLLSSRRAARDGAGLWRPAEPGPVAPRGLALDRPAGHPLLQGLQEEEGLHLVGLTDR